MLRHQNANVALDLNFKVGLAWMLGGFGGMDIRNAGPVAHHSGATLYHRSQLIVLPEQKLGVVVLANSATAGGVVNKVATEAVKLALEAKSGILQPEKIEMPTGEGTLTQAELQAYEGRYATMAGVVGLTKQSDYLRAEFMGKTLRLVPRIDGQLGIRYKLLGMFPISLGELDQVGVSRATLAGRDIVKASLNGQELLLGERITSVPLSEAMQKRTGEYEITNAGDDAVLFNNVQVRQDNGLLLVEYAMPLFTDGMVSIAITPLSDSEALTSGLGRGMGETIRIVNIGGEEQLRYSGYLLRKRQK
jgi:hypothetical protein